ncbi:MAG TPA: hypothetical protein VFK02_27445 [Kofleriaceae bacterium]|nr:hypothetical protein [Kofleriaceae bacterium]
MKSSGNVEPLREELARFTAEVQRLTLAIVRDILRKEVDLLRITLAQPAVAPTPRGGTIATSPAPAAAPARGRTRRATAASRLPPPAPPAPPAEPQAQPAPPESAPAPPAIESQEPSASPAPPAAPPATGRKRPAWTRDSIIEELASFILSGTEIDATFVQRHGPPGLVAAARRIFGRFDAALNVAGLHVSKLYPEGPPNQNARVPTRVR